MNEQAAIQQLKDGDIHGLEALVQLYQQPALRTACLITCDLALAEDVVQAAFLRVYERIHQFDAQRPFGPWFLRSVANAAIKAANRQSRHRSLDHHPAYASASRIAALVHSQHDDPEELLERAETRQEVWNALARITPAQRAAIILRYYLDLPEAEVAQQLGCPPGTAKRRLHDARARLRHLLRDLSWRQAYQAEEEME